MASCPSIVDEPYSFNPLQRMKPEPQESNKNLKEDQKTFHELPAQTQKLLLLSVESEKSIGKDLETIDDKINKPAWQAKP